MTDRNSELSTSNSPAEPTFESAVPDAQQASADQSKSHRVKTALEFFREKFAEEETESVWIDPKDETVNGLEGDE